MLGICGGYQMLATHIDDTVESGPGAVDGLGLLPVRVKFDPGKTVGRSAGHALGAAVDGYEIHHGLVRVTGDGRNGSWTAAAGPGGAVSGTNWHGTMETDEFRRAFLTEVARLAGRDFTPAPDTEFAALREHGWTRSATWSRITSTPRRWTG